MAGLTQEPAPVSATLAPIDNTTTYGLRRTDFTVKGGTGLELNSNGQEAKKPSFEAEFVQITEQTRQEYSTFLTNHLNGLIRLRNQKSEKDSKKSKFDELVKEVPTHAYEAQLLDQIMGSDGKIDQKKLSDFLSTSKGYIFTTQLIEEMTSAKLFMLGLKGIKEPAGGREQIVDELRVKLGVDQGAVNKLLSKMPAGFQAFVSSQLIAGGVAAAGEAIVRMLGNDRKLSFNDTNYLVPNESFLAVAAAPAAVAATLATVVGGGRLIGRSLKDGVTLDLKRSLSGLRMLQGNPQEAAYLKAMTGVDVNDYDTTDDTLSFRSGRISESTTDPNQLRLEILQGTYARQHFLEDIGVDPKKTDATPNQWLFGKLRHKKGESASLQDLQPEQLGTTWDQMVVEKFKPNDGGVRDKMGRHVGDEFFGTSRDIRIQFEETSGNWIDITREDPRYKANSPNIRTFQRRILYKDPAIQVSGSPSKFREWKPGDPDPDLIPSFIFIEKGEDIFDSVKPSQIENADPNIFVSWNSKNVIRNSAGEYFMKGITGQNLQYNPEVLDTEGNLRRYADAKREVMGQLLKEFVAEEVQRETEAKQQEEEKKIGSGLSQASGTLDERIARIDSGEYQKVQKDRIQLAEQKLESRLSEVEAELVSFEQIQSLRKRQDEIVQELTDPQRLNITITGSDIIGSIDSEVKSIDRSIGTAQRNLEKIQSEALAQATTLAQTHIQTLIGALNGRGQLPQQTVLEIYNEAKQIVQSVTGQKIEAGRQKLQDSIERKRKLLDIKTEYLQNNQDLQKHEHQIVDQAPKQLYEMSTDVSQFISGVPSSIPQLSLSDLATKSTQEILEMFANNAYPNAPQGDDLRKKVLHAQAEAQAQLTDQRMGVTRSTEFGLLVDPAVTTGAIITPDDLLTKSDTELEVMVTNPIYASLGLSSTQDRLNLIHIVQQEARRFAVLRHEKILRIEKSYLQYQLKETETNKQKIDAEALDKKKQLTDMKVALPQIQAASAEQGTIFTRVRDELVQNTDYYLEATAVANTNTHYTAAEQNAAYPEGYYRMLNLIFDYQEKPDRDNIFAQVSTVLPPARLAKHLNDSLGLGVASGSVDFPTVAAAITLRKNSLGPQDYRRAIRDVINDLRLEALAKT